MVDKKTENSLNFMRKVWSRYAEWQLGDTSKLPLSLLALLAAIELGEELPVQSRYNPDNEVGETGAEELSELSE